MAPQDRDKRITILHEQIRRLSNTSATASLGNSTGIVVPRLPLPVQATTSPTDKSARAALSFAARTNLDGRLNRGLEDPPAAGTLEALASLPRPPPAPFAASS